MNRRMNACLSAVLAGLLLTSPVGRAAWVDDWIDQHTGTDASYFEGQKRGYFTAGGFQARWRNANDHLFTISKPRITAGCGGIDLFMGGFSFLNPEYLVDKFQRIIQMAPALAFDIGLKALTEQVAGSMKDLSAATDWLNQLQVNDCAIAQQMVEPFQDDIRQFVQSAWQTVASEKALDDGTSDNYHDTQDQIRSNQGKSPVDIRETIEQCPQDFIDIFGGGSVVDNAAQKVNMGQYADLIRGWVGDVVVGYNAGSQLYDFEFIDRCERNIHLSPEEFLEGAVYKRPLSGTKACELDGERRLDEFVKEQLQAVSAKIDARAALSDDQQTFINTTSLPVYRILQSSAGLKDQGATMDRIGDTLARAFAHRVLQDLYNAMDQVLRTAVNTPTVGVKSEDGDGADCNPIVVGPAIQRIAGFRREVFSLKIAVWESMGQQMRAMLTAMRSAQQEKVREIGLLRVRSGQMGGPEE